MCENAIHNSVECFSVSIELKLAMFLIQQHFFRTFFCPTDYAALVLVGITLVLV